MGGRSAPTVCPIRTSKPSYHCRSPGIQSWTAAQDMASHSPQTHPCWSGTLPQVRGELRWYENLCVCLCDIFIDVDECALFSCFLSKWPPALYNSALPAARQFTHTLCLTYTQTHIDPLLAFKLQGTVPERPQKQQSHLLILFLNSITFHLSNFDSREPERDANPLLCLSCEISQ